MGGDANYSVTRYEVSGFARSHRAAGKAENFSVIIVRLVDAATIGEQGGGGGRYPKSLSCLYSAIAQSSSVSISCMRSAGTTIDPVLLPIST